MCMTAPTMGCLNHSRGRSAASNNPETHMSPLRGETYGGQVRVRLRLSERSERTRYAPESPVRRDPGGICYSKSQPNVVEKTTVLWFRSKGLAGDIAPAKIATLTITSRASEVTPSFPTI